MGFFGQVVAYLRALAFETATGAILASDVVALLALVAFPHLEARLATGTWALAIAAAGYAVGNFQLYRRRDPLLPAGAASIELGSLDPQVRKAGIEALFDLSIDRHGGLARRILSQAARHHQWADVRRSATICLAEIAIRRRHEAALDRDTAEANRWRAAGCISSRLVRYIREITVIRVLRVLLNDLQRTAPVNDRILAARLMGQLPSKLSSQYLAAIVNKRPVRNREAAMEETLVRVAAVEALGDIGVRAISVLAPLTQDEELGAAAIGSLAKLVETGGRDRDAGIQELLRRAAEGQRGIDEALLSLADLPQRIGALIDDPCLGPKTADLLGQLISPRSSYTRRLTLDGADISPKDSRKVPAVVALENAVRSGTEATRKYSAQALGRGSIGVWALIRLLNDRREDALAGLASAPPSAIESWELSEDSATVIPRILDSLSFGNEAVRASAAEALGALQAVPCITDLASVANDPSAPQRVRLGAIKGLAKMGTKEAVPSLRAIALYPASPAELVGEIRGALRLLASGPEWWNPDQVPEAREALNDLDR